MTKQKLIIGLICLLTIVTSCTRTPKAISLNETEEKAKQDILKIEEIKKNNSSWEENIEIDLYTAIALAIKNNKELRIKQLETGMANRQIDKVRFEMLPAFAANAGYTGSERYSATTSATVASNDLAGSLGSSYSTSRERDVEEQDIGFTWNALDFGLSFIRAGQDSNRYLITEEMERKAEHNIVRDVIRAYWNTISADKLIKKYDPLLVEVDKALNDSQKIEELLLTKPMDALLYQKELLDIQRALQSQKEMFIDSRIQLAGLMGLLPNETFKIVPTDEPLTILNMDLEGMEKYALLHRPELIKSHYDERISSQETKAGMISLLPGLNFNAAWTHSSNDHLMNKTNFEYGSAMGTNLLNIFMHPKIKRINETNTKIIKEKRLALSMAVLSQVHLANIDYSLALEEYDTAERYYEVSRKITEQVKNAQKIARFGNLELIREQASLLVAELRYDIAYSKLQHSIGKIYTSVGIDITRENINNINFKDYASIIRNNFKTRGKTYYARIKKPIGNQNPIAKKHGESSVSQFSFSEKTFELEGEGRVTYNASLDNDKPLPSWITFLPSQKTFIINNSDKDNTEELKIKVTAKNINTRIEDTFTLLVDPELRVMRLEEEKRLKEQRKLAKKRKEEEIKRLKAEKLLKEKKEKEEAELLAKKIADEELRKQKEIELKLIEEKKKEEALLAKKKADELRKQKEIELKLIEEKKKEEALLAKKKADELKLIQDKEKNEKLLALKKEERLKLLEEKKNNEKILATELKKINKNKIERNTLMAKIGKLEDAQYGNNILQNNFSKKLEEGKIIENKINKVFLDLDLDSRIALAQKIMEDIVKSNVTFKDQVNLANYKHQDYKYNNQIFMLEKLLNYSNIRNTNN